MQLSIIIVSFNTLDITLKCLKSLKKNFVKYPLKYEVVVVDNGSVDGTPEALTDLKKEWPNLRVILTGKNLGYGRANNRGTDIARGKYVLYLNSDAIVTEINFSDLIGFFDRQKKLGALTVKVMLSNGEIDPASHRGFPTPWASFTYFLGLEKVFLNVPYLNQLFGQYHQVHNDLKTIHEIDVPTGAFLMVRSEIIKEIKGFDRDYFAYGEDIEMAYRIKELGYKILYYPLWTVLHLKSVSGLKKKDYKIRSKTRFHFYDSMKIFYRKHYEKKYPWIFNQLIYLAIDLKRTLSS
jgi:hypothetical protein